MSLINLDYYNCCWYCLFMTCLWLCSWTGEHRPTAEPRGIQRKVWRWKAPSGWQHCVQLSGRGQEQAGTQHCHLAGIQRVRLVLLATKNLFSLHCWVMLESLVGNVEKVMSKSHLLILFFLVHTNGALLNKYWQRAWWDCIILCNWKKFDLHPQMNHSI